MHCNHHFRRGQARPPPRRSYVLHLFLSLTASILLLFSAAKSFAQNAWGDTPYGAYGLFPQGSDRVMALGGASVAIIDDPTAILFNPAGAALGTWKADFGSTNNRIDHRELSYNFPNTYATYETQYDSPYSYFVYAGAVRIGGWVIGLAYSSPYFYEYAYINPLSNREIERFEVKVQSFDYMIARQFGKYFAIGIAGHDERLREFYLNRSLPEPVPGGFESTGSNSYFSGGLAFRTHSFGVGASYSPRRTFKVDTSVNDLLAVYNTTPFRDAVIPAKTSYGVFVKPWKRLLVTIDLDMIEKLDRAVYVSAATTSTEYLKSESIQLVHGGIELIAYTRKWFELILRTGGYLEPSRIEGGRDRQHLTYGAEVHLGPVVLSYGADEAPMFKNSAFSASLSLGSI